MKSLVTGLVAAAAVVLTLAAPAPASAQQNARIIVVSHGQANDPFWSVVKNGVTAAGQDMKVQVDYRAPETFDMVAMSQLIDAAVNQKPAGLDRLDPRRRRRSARRSRRPWPPASRSISMNSGSRRVQEARRAAACRPGRVRCRPDRRRAS